MKRLLVCLVLVTALVALFALAPPASAADRGFALLDNVPIEATPQLANDIAQSVVATNDLNSIDQTAMDVATLGAVGQQSALSYTALNVNATTGDENRGSTSTPGTKRVGQTTARYSGDRFTGDLTPALRPDPHLQQAQVATG